MSPPQIHENEKKNVSPKRLLAENEKRLNYHLEGKKKEETKIDVQLRTTEIALAHKYELYAEKGSDFVLSKRAH